MDTARIRDDFTEQFLVRFGVPGREWSIDGQRLLDPDGLEAFLEEYRGQMGAPDDPSAASRWSYHVKDTVLYGSLYLLGRWNARINWSPQTVTFARFSEADRPGHRWGLHCSTDVELVVDEDRARQRERVLENTLNQFLRPMFEQLSELTGLSTRLLWQNMAHVLYLWYPAWIGKTEDERVKQQFRDDYETLRSLSADRFAAAGPFRRVFEQMSNTDGPDTEPVRPGCCLNYRLERYCPECPLVHKANYEGPIG